MKLGEFELNKIYCMDCLEGLKKLPDNSIDLILTDPPYNITKNNWDIFETPDFVTFTEEWLDECYRISRGKYMLTFWSQQKLDLFDKLNIKWKKKRVIIWYMPNAPISNNDGLIFTWQPCILLEKESDIFIINNGRDFISNDVLKFNFPVKERFGHPTIKPIKLIRALVKKYSEEESFILDPFMGSGTTAVACKQSKRNFLGFEINPEYIKIANKRLAQKVLKL